MREDTIRSLKKVGVGNCLEGNPEYGCGRGGALSSVAEVAPVITR